MRPGDTSEAAYEAQLEVHRAMTPAERVELAIEMSEQARAISIRGILDRDPTLDEATARARLLRQLLGDELFDAAYAQRAS